LDKEFTMVIYMFCTIIKLTCTYNISQLKEILNFQKCYLLKKCMGKAQKLTHKEIGITATISSGL
jgi:hypothetical protein